MTDLTDETIREWIEPKWKVNNSGFSETWSARTRVLGEALLAARASYRDALDMLRDTSRRVMLAEADNAVLVEAALELALEHPAGHQSNDLLTRRLHSAQPSEDLAGLSMLLRNRAILAQPHPGAALLERVSKLEAVVAAARTHRAVARVTDLCEGEDCPVCPAVAALDAEPETAPDLVAFRAARGALKEPGHGANQEAKG